MKFENFFVDSNLLADVGDHQRKVGKVACEEPLVELYLFIKELNPLLIIDDAFELFNKLLFALHFGVFCHPDTQLVKVLAQVDNLIVE